MLVEKKSKKSFLKALYSKRGKGRLFPLKILGGMSVVGSTLRHWMWGTQNCLESLIAPRNLHHVRSNRSYMCEPKISWSYPLKVKTPLFSSDGDKN